MRRLVYVTGVVTLIVIVLGATGFGYLAYKGNALDSESKAFANSAVLAIATKWNTKALLVRSTPELRGSVSPDRLKRVFDNLRRLGHLVRYLGAKGQARMSYHIGSGGMISAYYVARAKFEDGSARLQMRLVKRNGRWLILGLHIDPSFSRRGQEGA